LLVAGFKFGKDGTVSGGKQELERADQRWRSEKMQKAHSERERCIAGVAQASKQIAHYEVKLRELRAQLTSLEKRVELGSASRANTVKQLYESLAQLDRLVEDHRASEAECDRVSALLSNLLLSGVSLTSQCFLLFRE
jgi:chromosome segregation ATPase